MSTLREIVSNVRSMHRILSTDAMITDRAIASQIRRSSLLLIKRDLIMQKVTLKLIANMLGISVATVSKALKNYPDINKDTKTKVVNLAKSLNYKPNSFAQSLRNQESKVIGIIIPEIVHYFFSNIILSYLN